MEGKYIDVKKAAEILNVTPHYVRALLREGKIKGDKETSNNQWRVSLQSLKNYRETDVFKNDLELLRKDGFQITIKDAVENVEEYFETDIVSYISLPGSPASTIDMNDCILLDNVLENMEAKYYGDKKFKKLTLFLHSGGGFLESAIKFVNIIDQYADTFEVIVPMMAKSAATVICLKSSRLYLTTLSELGPVDPIIQSPTNPALNVPATAIDAFIEHYGKSVGGETGRTPVDEFIIKKLESALDPYLLGSYKQALKFSQEEIENSLREHFMKGSSEEDIKAAVDEFTVKYSSHKYPITYNTLKKYNIGEKITDKNKLKHVKVLLNIYLQYMKNTNVVKLVGNRDENKNTMLRNKNAETEQVPSHTAI